jgi:hypothetical protein
MAPIRKRRLTQRQCPIPHRNSRAPRFSAAWPYRKPDFARAFRRKARTDALFDAEHRSLQSDAHCCSAALLVTPRAGEVH